MYKWIFFAVIIGVAGISAARLIYQFYLKRRVSKAPRRTAAKVRRSGTGARPAATTGRQSGATSRPVTSAVRQTGSTARPTTSVVYNGAARSTEETGPMIYYANGRHHSRDKEYRFNYKKVNGSWRAYIQKMPDLNGRDPSAAITHRLYDNGRPYVCWNQDVRTLEDMQAISRVWADSIQEYIATGKRFG